MPSIDYMQFQSPYTTKDRIVRILWTVVWNMLAHSFPKSTMMSWKRFLLSIWSKIKS
jgi:hypothetical protein